MACNKQSMNVGCLYISHYLFAIKLKKRDGLGLACLQTFHYDNDILHVIEPKTMGREAQRCERI